MAQAFADQSGGAFDIVSRPGEGTAVTLWLPLADAESAQPARPGIATLPVAARGSSARVLLVDDDHTTREVLAIHLEDAGYQVETAAGAAEALALLDAEPAFDALLTDLSMPGMDGLALIRTARQRFPGLQALLLTGTAVDDAAFDFGAAISLLRKPVRDTELLDRLGTMLATAGQPSERQVAVSF